MRGKVVEKTFEAIFALEDLRELLRKTAPFDLTKEQIDEAKKILAKVRKTLDEIDMELK
jgi:Sep-tRNA:Cys-tRNA synthetase